MIRPTFQGGLLTHTQLLAYHRALASSHRVACRVQILDTNEQPRAEIGLAAGSGLGRRLAVSGGEVTVDATDPTRPARSLTLTLLDPDRRFHLEPDSAGDYGLFAGDMIRVLRGDHVPDLDGWVWCPVFTGPVSGFNRDYPEVTISAVGKEALALDPYVTLSAITAARGVKVTTAIRRVMGETGEQRFGFPDVPARLGHRLSVPRLSEPWRSAQRLAGTINRQLFYDGRGVLQLRRSSTNPVFTFGVGRGGVLLQAPVLAYDFTAFRNTADVTGGVPKKQKRKVHVIETVAGGNPLSPAALARNGHPAHAVVVVEDPQILRRAAAEARGRSELSSALLLATDPSSSTFDALPIPHLEELDLVRVHTDQGFISLRMKSWTIPLGADSMPVGVRRVSRWRARYRPTRRGRRHP